MTAEEIRRFCWDKQWQPGVGEHSFENLNLYPAWGETADERLASWTAIEDAWVSGRNHWMRPFAAVDLPRRDGETQRVISCGGELRRGQDGKSYYITVLVPDCLDCGKKFEFESRYPILSVPEACPACRAQSRPVDLSVDDTEPKAKGRFSPVKSAVREAIDSFAMIGDKALMDDMLGAIVPKLNEPKGLRDTRRATALQALRRESDIEIDGDIVRFI